MRKEDEKKTPQRLRDCFYDAYSIAEEWLGMNDDQDNMGKNKDEIKKEAEKITRKFRNMLKEIGFDDKQICLFRTDSPDGHGQFIFSSADAPEIMRDILEMYYGNHRKLTYCEGQDLVEKLVEMLPAVRKLEDINILNKADELSYNEAKDLHDKMPDNCENREMIATKVQNYVLEYCIDSYDKQMFVYASAEKMDDVKKRTHFYGFQYATIRSWEERWKTLWETVQQLREAEQFDINTCDKEGRKIDKISSAFLWDEVIKNYKKEKRMQSEKIKKSMTMEDCYDECSKLVREILSLTKGKGCILDNNEMRDRAYADLENVCQDIIKERNIIYYSLAKQKDMNGEKTAKDPREVMELLYKIRRDIDTEFSGNVLRKYLNLGYQKDDNDDDENGE